MRNVRQTAAAARRNDVLSFGGVNTAEPRSSLRTPCSNPNYEEGVTSDVIHEMNSSDTGCSCGSAVDHFVDTAGSACTMVRRTMTGSALPAPRHRVSPSVVDRRRGMGAPVPASALRLCPERAGRTAGPVTPGSTPRSTDCLTRWKRAERGELLRASCGRSVMSRGDVSSAADRDPHGERGDIGGDPQLRPAHDRMDPDRTQWRHACLRRGSRESWQGIGGPRFAQWVAAGIIAPIAGLGGEPSEGGRTAAPDRRLRSPVSELGERPSDVAPACCCTNLP